MASDKIFCIGFGKTGTTSMNELMVSFGVTVGDQAAGELLIDDWTQRNFAPIIEHARSAQFFQDIPFCLPFTAQAMDMAFPGAKFILTVRKDSAEWYGSLVRFHSMIMGTSGAPTARDLQAFPYRGLAWIWQAHRALYGVDEEGPYDRDTLIRTYELHNSIVRKYFEHRPDSLLVIDVSESNAAERIADFVGHRYRGEAMPHSNKSSGARAGAMSATHHASSVAIPDRAMSLG